MIFQTCLCIPCKGRGVWDLEKQFCRCQKEDRVLTGWRLHSSLWEFINPSGLVQVVLHLGEDQVACLVLMGLWTRHPGRSPSWSFLGAEKIPGCCPHSRPRTGQVGGQAATQIRGSIKVAAEARGWVGGLSRLSKSPPGSERGESPGSRLLPRPRSLPPSRAAHKF